MNCPRCNTPLVADARFCGICGYAVPTLAENADHANASPAFSENDGATLMSSSWPGAQQAEAQPQPFSPRSPQYSAPTVRQMSPAPQPGTFQQSQGGSWPQQGSQADWRSPEQLQAGSWPQQQPANWQQPMQPQGGSWPQQDPYAQGMMPGTLNSTGGMPEKKRRRGGRILARMLLVLVLLVAILAGAWFFGVRPYLHNMAQTQLNQALDGAESQILLFQDALPSGSQSVAVDENTINTYLSSHSGGQLQNLRATITPQSFNLDFSAYGFHSTINAVPIASRGLLQVTNVQVQGMLGLVMSNDELTSALNSNFQNFGQQMHRTIGQVTLKEHEMDIIVN